MASTPVTSVIQRAGEMIDVGDCQSAYKLLAPLLAAQNPEAQFLYATFSISGMETVEEFEARSISLLQAASDAGYAPAMYALAVCYDAGDMVGRDSIRASVLYKKAAEAGNPKAKLSHGLDLFYGSNGMPKDEQRGLILIKQAMAENVDDAVDALERLKTSDNGRG